MSRSSPQWSVQDGRDFVGDEQAAETALTKLTVLYQDRLMAGLKNAVRHLPFEAEDVVNKAFLRAWDRRHGFNPEAGGGALPWLYAIVRNVFADMVGDSIEGPRIYFRKLEKEALRKLPKLDRMQTKRYAYHGGDRSVLEPVLAPLDSKAKAIILDLLDRSDDLRNDFRQRKVRGQPTDVVSHFRELIARLRTNSEITEEAYATIVDGIFYGRFELNPLQAAIGQVPSTDLEQFEWCLDGFVEQWSKFPTDRDNVDRIVFRETRFALNPDRWAHDLAERIVPTTGDQQQLSNSVDEVTRRDRHIMLGPPHGEVQYGYGSDEARKDSDEARKDEVNRVATLLRQRWNRLKKRIDGEAYKLPKNRRK